MSTFTQSVSVYKTQLIIVGLTYFANFLFGLCMNWTAPVVILLKDPEKTPLPEAIDDITASWVGSVLYLGLVTGPATGNFISNKYGRKPAMLFGSCFCIIAFVIQSFFTTHVNMLYIQRVIQGFGMFSLNICAGVYVGEIASTEIRGCMLGVGTLYSSFASLLLLGFAPFMTFVQIGYFGLGLSILMFFIVFLLPESPLWLALNGNQKMSDEVMRSLNRQDFYLIYNKTEEKTSWKILFQTKANRKALFLGVFLFLGAGFSGSITVTFYTTSIYEMANLKIDSDIASIITHVVSFLVAFLSAAIVDKVGRRILLLVSTCMTSFSLIVLGLYYYLDSIHYSDIESIKWLPIVCVTCFTLSNVFGLLVIPSTLMSEMFDKNARSWGVTVAVLPGTIAGFVSTSMFGYMISYMGIHTTFWLHSIANVVAFIFTLIFLPETKGKSFEEIQKLLNK